MDKYDFLLALEDRLAGLPEADRQASLDFYAEMLDDLTEGGMTERDAVASLGSPDAIAEEILLEMPLPKLVKAKMKKRRLSGLEITLLAVGFPIWLPILIALLPWRWLSISPSGRWCSASTPPIWHSPSVSPRVSSPPSPCSQAVSPPPPSSFSARDLCWRD